MTTREQITTFFETKVPKSWFVGAPKIELDDDEVLYVGTLPDGRSADDFRGETLAERVAIASEAETRFRRKVSWGVVAQGETVLFTTHGAPLNGAPATSERAVLDTLVNAGVARSRSRTSLGWCVKLVARHQSEWLDDLRGALVDVERVRAEGPTLI